MKKPFLTAFVILTLLFTVQGAIAAPGDILAQFPNGTAANDFVPSTYITYSGQQIVIGTADGNAREVNVTSGANWNGKVINATIVIHDPGTAMSSGQNFFWGFGDDESVGPNSWSTWFGIGCSNTQYGSWQTAGAGCGVADTARVTGNVTLQIWANTSATTNNVNYYFNGALITTASVNFGAGDIDVTGFYHGNSIGVSWNAYNFTICEEYCGTTAPAIPTITASLSNAVNGSSFGSVSFSNVTGNLTFNYFNITETGFCVTYTGNGTGTNCTSGNGASTYFNVTNTTTITGTQTVTANTYQSLLQISAYRLFLNTSIASFNGTNSQATNTTTTGTALIKALSGSNNIKIDVGGNYSKNVTCTVTTPLSTNYCNVTGVYDNLFTIGAKYLTTSISNFTVHYENTTIHAAGSNSTTAGYVTFPLLQGYYYSFNISPSSVYSFGNVTIPANASTNLYNFSLLLTNTFNVSFYDEIADTLINESMTLELISDYSSATYTIVNGTGNVSLLIPADYTLRYRNTNYQERDYYTTLYNGSFTNVELFAITINASSQVIVTVEDTAGDSVQGATVKLLRYFPDCNCYKIVEMAKTGFNGQAGIWVEAVDGFYKWIVEYNDITQISTEFENILTNTRTFTINTGDDYLETFVGINYVTHSIAVNRGAGSVTFTWNDPQSHVNRGCLTLDYANGSRWESVNNCADGASGSVIITGINNDTNYKYTGSITTNSAYSDNNLEQGWIDSLVSYQFGVVGAFLSGGIIMTLAAIFSFSAVAVLMISAVGVILLSFMALTPFTMNFMIGLGALAIGLSLYLLRR